MRLERETRFGDLRESLADRTLARVLSSNALKVRSFAVDRHIETRSLSGFIDFHCCDSVDDPEHHVSKDERPDRGEADRA